MFPCIFADAIVTCFRLNEASLADTSSPGGWGTRGDQKKDDSVFVLHPRVVLVFFLKEYRVKWPHPMNKK